MSFFNESENDQFSSCTSPFVTNQVFSSREEMMDWAKTTAYSLGYVLVTKRSKKYKNGFIWKVYLMCDRSGRYKRSESSIGTSTKKTDCPFELIGQYSTSHGYWTIRVVCDQHNHPSTQNLEGHAYARRLSDDEYRLVEDLTWKNVRPREILSTLKDQNKNNLSTLPTIYDAQHKIRKIEYGGKTPMQVLMSLLHINRYVYEPFINPITNELQALFFVHPTSYQIWRAFPHVLIIDATYKTNIYNMPFVQIVGVTSTSKTFCIAFVFISDERMENYKWALEQLNLTLKECMRPRVIVTDRELALMKACEIVFPHAKHLLCRWHIGQNIWKNCRQTIRSNRDWDRFQSMWKLLQDSPTWISYEENYEKLRTFLSKYPRVLKYLHDNWLDKYKDHFVSASIDQSLNFGNRTTNRVESQHAKFKDYMTCRNYTLDKFIVCIDKIVMSQLTAIKESFGSSEISRYHKHNIPCFSLLRGVVSNEAIDLMVKEINRSNDFQLDSLTCGCQLYNSCGLPCACRLSLYVRSGEFIPLDSIDIFWRTLNLSPTISLQSDNICCDTEINHFKENFNKQPEAGKRSFLRKLVDIFNPSKTTMKPPAVKKNTRGRPSLNKQKKYVPPKSKDPRKCSETARFFDINLNMEPERHSSYTNYQTNSDRDPIPDLNEEPTRHSSFVDLNEEPTNFFDYMPEIFHQHIIDFYDVGGDGNCGFRSVALGLGLHEDEWPQVRLNLVRELTTHRERYKYVFGSLGYDNIYKTVKTPGEWMLMPNTGLVIASAYNRVVICLANGGSVGGSTICFPLWSSPPQSQQHEDIVIAHVNGNHYIRVTLQEGCPLPLTHPLWEPYRSDVASRWEHPYLSRQDEFREYHYVAPQAYDIS